MRIIARLEFKSSQRLHILKNWFGPNSMYRFSIKKGQGSAIFR